MVNIKDAPHPCGKSMRGNNQCPKRRSGTVVHADMSCCYQCSECLPLSSTWNTTNYCTVSSLMCNKVGDKTTHLAASSIGCPAAWSWTAEQLCQAASGHAGCKWKHDMQDQWQFQSQPAGEHSTTQLLEQQISSQMDEDLFSVAAKCSSSRTVRVRLLYIQMCVNLMSNR